MEDVCRNAPGFDDQIGRGTYPRKYRAGGLTDFSVCFPLVCLVMTITDRQLYPGLKGLDG